MRLKDTQTIFGALSDPTRFRILNLLSEGELCVCDMMSVLKEPQSKISRHLAYLRRARLVESRKEGLWMYYCLTRERLSTFKAIFEALNCCRSDFSELQRDLTEFRKNKKGLVACCK